MNRLAAMEAFVRVVETGSFSGAARHLRVGQPAISKAVAQLEGRLGVRLLLRSTHKVMATEAGQNFYDLAKRAIAAVDEADLAARGAGAALTGRLRVCAAVTFARIHIIPHLRAFLAEHPALTIDVILDDRNTDLIEAGGDIALRMGDLTDSALTSRRIGRANRRVLGTPSYFEAFGRPQAPEDLNSHEAIIYDRGGGGAVWAFQKGSANTVITQKGRINMNAAEGVREAVFNDIGLTVSSEWMFAPELKSGRVEAVLTDWTLPPIDLWAVFPTGRQASVKARAFASFVETRLFATEFALPD